MLFHRILASAAVPPASLRKRMVFNKSADVLNSVTARRSSHAGARFADVQPLFAGNGCAAPIHKSPA